MVILDLGTTWSVDINSSLPLLLVEIIRRSSWTSWHKFWIRHHHLILSIIATITLKTFLTGTVELLIVILGKMIWVNHGEHLRESLTNSSNPLTWISEWKLAPRLIINTFTVEINNVLSTGSTRSST